MRASEAATERRESAVERATGGMVEDTGEKSRQGQVWAGTYDPRSSDVVRNVEASLVHRMMDPGVLTPGEKFNRDRDRDSFRKALGNLNDGLSDLCHGMLQRVEMYEDDSWPPEMNMRRRRLRDAAEVLQQIVGGTARVDCDVDSIPADCS